MTEDFAGVSTTESPDVRSGALDGVVVLEVGGYLAAPLATSILGSLGARVIKVETPTGDPFRAQQGLWVSTNTGKESVTCDLSTDEGQRLLESLVRHADVLVENLSPDAVREFGLTHERMEQLNPDIITCSIKAFGAGPYENRRATNPIIEAIAGLMAVTWQDGRPARQAVPLFDQMAGALAVIGILAALATPRERCSRRISVGLYETALYMAGSRLAGVQLGGSTSPKSAMFELAPYGTFKTADGDWVFVGVINDRCWRELGRVLRIEGFDRPEWTTSALRAASVAEIESVTQSAIAGMSSRELIEAMHDQNIPCSRVNTFEQVLMDPHTRAEGKLIDVPFSDMTVQVPAFPLVSGGVSEGGVAGPPQLGEHTDSVLDWLKSVASNGHEDD